MLTDDERAVCDCPHDPKLHRPDGSCVQVGCACGTPPSISLVAFSPHEIQSAQAGLIEWFGRKISDLKRDEKTHRENWNIARNSKWKSEPFKRLMELAKKRITYYEKAIEILRAGYLLIPNLPLEVFAIRTARERPLKKQSTSEWDHHIQPAQQLPADKGRYVQRVPFRSSIPYQERDEKTGQVKEKTTYFATRFEEHLEFPTVIVKPSVLDATKHALALKLFDEIGVVQQPSMKRDPIVAGRIIDPRSSTHSQRHMTFFIAWWLETNDL